MEMKEECSKSVVKMRTEILKLKEKIMNLKTIVTIVAVLAVMVTGSVATADYVRTTDDGNGADSYVAAAAADTNYGHEHYLSNKSGRMAYAKFDISTWNDNATVTSATFELTWAFGSWGRATSGILRVYAVDDDVVGGDDWGDRTITWTNAPGNDTGEANGVIADDTTWVCEFNWTAEPADGDTVSATITLDSRLAFINDSLGAGGDDLVTFIVNFKESAGNSNVNFASKEYTPTGGSLGDWAPKLTLVPEPATMALLGIGGIGLLLRRRRR